MKVYELTVKSALSPSRLPGLEYALNPYLGCQHQCRYCYAPGILHLDREEWETMVGVKRNLPLVLSKEIKQRNPGVIGLSTVTDPYQPIEETYKITRYCLDILKRYDFPLSIQTKSDLILRDKGVITQCTDVEVMVSIGTLDDTQRQILEPSSSSIPKRLSVLKSFAKTPVKTSVFFGPIYPTISVDEIPHAMEVFESCGIDEIMIDSLHVKKEIIPIMQRVQQSIPELTCTSNMIQDHFNKIKQEIIACSKQTSIHVKEAF